MDSIQYVGLVDAFPRKDDEFRDVIKMGRTQLRDAIPMIAQEFLRIRGKSGQHSLCLESESNDRDQ